MNESRELYVLVKNGTVINGAGVPPFVADIGIIANRRVRDVNGKREMQLVTTIDDMGDLRTLGALRTIDATGMTIVPLVSETIEAGQIVDLPEWKTVAVRDPGGRAAGAAGAPEAGRAAREVPGRTSAEVTAPARGRQRVTARAVHDLAIEDRDGDRRGRERSSGDQSRPPTAPRGRPASRARSIPSADRRTMPRRRSTCRRRPPASASGSSRRGRLVGLSVGCEDAGRALQDRDRIERCAGQALPSSRRVCAASFASRKLSSARVGPIDFEQFEAGLIGRHHRRLHRSRDAERSEPRDICGVDERQVLEAVAAAPRGRPIRTNGVA